MTKEAYKNRLTKTSNDMLKIIIDLTKEMYDGWEDEYCHTNLEWAKKDLFNMCDLIFDCIRYYKD